MIRFQTEYEPLTCSIDPITAIGLAIAGLGGAAASGMMGGGSTPTPTPTAPPAMAAPQQTPTGQRPQTQSNQPSFVGASAVPSSQSGQKTLLGQ